MNKEPLRKQLKQYVMKKLLLIIFGLSISIMLQAQSIKTVNVLTAGLLSSTVTALEKSIIINLTVTGTIDERDFVFIHDSMPALKVLDLKDVKIAAYGTVTTYAANSIPSSAFMGKALTSIYLPSTMTSIGNSAFANISTLTAIYCNIAIPPDLSKSQSVFPTGSTACKLYVPVGSSSAYKAAPQWNML